MSSTTLTPQRELDPNFTTLLRQGAEARVYKTKFYGCDAIVKERFKKEYRHPVLDRKITQKRTQSEGKNMARCLAIGLDVPTLFFVDDQHYDRIYMEFVNGCTVKSFFIQNMATNEEACLKLARKIGQSIATMHDEKIVHGDLTTSNMMLRDNNPEKLVFIDFGLSYQTSMDEDKAVDLYVLERAMLSTHLNSKNLFKQVLLGYQEHTKKSKSVLDKLNQVRLRGRKRDMIG